MPITIKTAAMKARESVNDPWETITVKAEAELETVWDITGDGNLDPGFTATDLTGAANELKNTLNQFDQNMAYVESGNTASRTYVKGVFISWKGTLYKANTAIPQGTTFSTGGSGNLSSVVDGNGDLCGGLNSLINSTFGTASVVTLPYSATQNGMMLISINPQTVAGGNALISSGGINATLSTANGVGNSISIPVLSGTNVTVVSSSNVNFSAKFFPMF